MVKIKDSEQDTGSKMRRAYLLLQDGTRFDGYSFGSEFNTSGELG